MLPNQKLLVISSLDVEDKVERITSAFFWILGRLTSPLSFQWLLVLLRCTGLRTVRAAMGDDGPARYAPSLPTMG